MLADLCRTPGISTSAGLMVSRKPSSGLMVLGRLTEAELGGEQMDAYLRRTDSCITQLKAQGPSRTCNDSREESKWMHLELPEGDVDGDPALALSLELVEHQYTNNYFTEMCSGSYLRIIDYVRWTEAELGGERTSNFQRAMSMVIPRSRSALSLSSTKYTHRNVQRFRGGLVFKAHRLCQMD